MIAISAQKIKKTGLGRREGRKRDIPALLLAKNKLLRRKMPNGVGLLKGNFSPNLQFFILPQLAGFGKRNFPKKSGFLLFISSPLRAIRSNPAPIMPRIRACQKARFGRLQSPPQRIFAQKIGLRSGGRRGENYRSPWSSFKPNYAFRHNKFSALNVIAVIFTIPL